MATYSSQGGQFITANTSGQPVQAYHYPNLANVLNVDNETGRDNITNIGVLQFTTVPLSTPVLNQTGTALKIQMNDYYIQVFTVLP